MGSDAREYPSLPARSKPPTVSLMIHSTSQLAREEDTRDHSATVCISTNEIQQLEDEVAGLEEQLDTALGEAAAREHEIEALVARVANVEQELASAALETSLTQEQLRDLEDKSDKLLVQLEGELEVRAQLEGELESMSLKAQLGNGLANGVEASSGTGTLVDGTSASDASKLNGSRRDGDGSSVATRGSVRCPSPIHLSYCYHRVPTVRVHLIVGSPARDPL